MQQINKIQIVKHSKCTQINPEVTSKAEVKHISVVDHSLYQVFVVSFLNQKWLKQVADQSTRLPGLWGGQMYTASQQKLERLFSKYMISK